VSTPFDTLKLATKLEQTGFTPDQARGAASALAEALSDEMVTKSYLDGRLKELQLKVGAMIVALGGVLVAIKFLGH
jgi:hypothetical protein